MSLGISNKDSTKNPDNIISVQFEVFGKVQGVFFRKCTAEQALSLGLRGYVRNTANDSVIGELQGPETKVKSMQLWLTYTGSPQSNIAKVEFKNLHIIDEYNYSTFKIER